MGRGLDTGVQISAPGHRPEQSLQIKYFGMIGSFQLAGNCIFQIIICACVSAPVFLILFAVVSLPLNSNVLLGME